LLLEQLDHAQRHTLRSLAVSVEMLGHLQREQGVAACVDSYQEAMEIFERIGAQAGVAIIALNLGQVYSGDVPALRDLALAEQWCRRSLELSPESDRLRRGQALGQLGYVARECFLEAWQTGQPSEVLAEHLNAALQFYQQKQALDPQDAIDERAITHNALGVIYRQAGETEQAVAHYRESIRYLEQMGDHYGAAQIRDNVATAYADAGRFEDALLFAHAALHIFQQFGPAAAAAAAKVQQTIAWIEGLARGEAGG
jgi:tetratricopeptide (TPR) repeat protein